MPIDFNHSIIRQLLNSKIIIQLNCVQNVFDLQLNYNQTYDEIAMKLRVQNANKLRD